MKRCPTCIRDYYDDSLLFCLDDGVALLNGPSGPYAKCVEPATLSLSKRSGLEPSSYWYSNAKETSEGANTIAVLPFANHSRLENTEYFSDGLADELVNVLASISGLRVVGRTSSFAVRGKQLSVEEIGRTLQVRTVLEGSVRVEGERVRIAVQLVDVRNGYQLWADTFDRTMDDIFAIQDEIARSVVVALCKRFPGTSEHSRSEGKLAEEVTIAMNGRFGNPEAHRLMLMGRYLLERLNEDDAVKAVGYLQQALDIDPRYAQAWALLGRAYYVASNHGWSDLDTKYAKAEESLKWALEFDPNLPEAYAWLGRIRWYRDGDFLGTEKCLNRALVLAPNNVDVLLSAVPTARDTEQLDTAIEHCRRAVAIDPLSPTAWSTTAVANFLSGDTIKAEFAARRALELAPQRIVLHACLGLILLCQGRMDEALEEALLETERSPWRSWSLAIVHHAAGQSAASDREIAKLVAEHAARSSFQIAEAYSMRGELDEAFRWLERSIDQSDPGRLGSKVSPLLRLLHSDLRWPSLLARIGFPLGLADSPERATSASGS